MSSTETEIVVSTSDALDETIRKRTAARAAELTPLLSRHNSIPRRVCRRHSYAFRCTHSQLAEQGDGKKHNESVLLVKVYSHVAKVNCEAGLVVGEDGSEVEEP